MLIIRLFAAGAKGVVIANRGPKEDPNTEEVVEDMKKRAKDKESRLVYIPFDVTEADKAQDFVEKAEAELGEIHGLVSERYITGEGI